MNIFSVMISFWRNSSLTECAHFERIVSASFAHTHFANLLKAICLYHLFIRYAAYTRLANVKVRSTFPSKRIGELYVDKSSNVCFLIKWLRYLPEYFGPKSNFWSELVFGLNPAFGPNLTLVRIAVEPNND